MKESPAAPSLKTLVAPGPPWRIVLFDDQTTGMELFSPVLEKHPDMKVLGSLKSAENVEVQLKHFRPHLVIVDLQARRMNALDLIEKVTQIRPTPVLLIIPPKRLEAERVIRAMELGPVFCFERPSTLKEFQSRTAELVELCSQAAASGVGLPILSPASHQAAEVPPPPVQRQRTLNKDLPVVSLGLSTGGPGALLEFLSHLQGPVGCGLVVAQHMLAGFMEALVTRLRERVGFHVELVDRELPIQAGTVYLPVENHHLLIGGSQKTPVVMVLPVPHAPKPACPSVDLLFESAARVLKDKSLGLVFTGMGRDGLEGAQAIVSAGGKVWAQSKESCVVYGMPRVVAEEGLAEQVLSPVQMALQLARLAGLPKTSA